MTITDLVAPEAILPALKVNSKKQALQELATHVADAFQAVAGEDRRVKVVIRPYDVEGSGWVSL